MVGTIVYWMVVITVTVTFGFMMGAMMTRLKLDRDIQRAAGRALAGRIAVGKILPGLEVADQANFKRWMSLMGAPEQADAEAARGLIDHALHIARAYLWGSGRYYRHVKRGTHYEVLSYQLHLQVSDPSLLKDQAELVLYIDTRSGRLSARHPVEFHDGRFEPVTRDVALDAEDIALQRNAGAPSKTYVDPDADLLGSADRVPYRRDLRQGDGL